MLVSVLDNKEGEWRDMESVTGLEIRFKEGVAIMYKEGEEKGREVVDKLEALLVYDKGVENAFLSDEDENMPKRGKTYYVVEL